MPQLFGSWVRAPNGSQSVLEGLFDLLVAFEGADVVAGTWHFVSMDWRLGGEPSNETAGGICATAFGYALFEKLQVGLLVEVEGGATPVALRVGGFLFHRENQAVGIDFGYAAFVEARLVGLVVAHDASGVLGLSVGEEVLKAEGEEVVACHDEEVFIDSFGINTQ